jgi:hypothetical protein
MTSSAKSVHKDELAPEVEEVVTTFSEPRYDWAEEQEVRKVTAAMWTPRILVSDLRELTRPSQRRWRAAK